MFSRKLHATVSWIIYNVIINKHASIYILVFEQCVSKRLLNTHFANWNYVAITLGIEHESICIVPLMTSLMFSVLMLELKLFCDVLKKTVLLQWQKYMIRYVKNKRPFGGVRPAKIQISLCIRTVWWESSLGTFD